jgi:uncharacterized protein (DUF1800 family)
MNKTIKNIAFLALWALPLAVFSEPAVLSRDDAAHFLLRTGFAPSPSELDALAGQNTRQAIERTLQQARLAKPQFSAPSLMDLRPRTKPQRPRTPEEQREARQQQFRDGLEIKAWWLHEMTATPAPLKERMTLFWHNHFATSQQKVVRSQAMWNQHLLLRDHALGNFGQLLHAIAKDPAMLVYLDGANSRKEAPNENFAREVMELFTLGESSQGGGAGHYTEADIREAARAFTGWSVEPGSLDFRFRSAAHDDGVKTVWGQSGNFDGDAVLDILLKQDATARFVVGKLWKEFVSPAPDAPEVERIARRFQDSGYDIRVALRELFLCDAFWAPGNRAALFKSPVDLVVGAVRQLLIPVADALPLALKTAQLGQNLLAPPNVKGWPGQEDWINAGTLVERRRFLASLFQNQPPPARRPPDGDMQAMAGNLVTSLAEEARPGQVAGAPPANAQLRAILGPAGLQRVAQGNAQLRLDAPVWLQGLGLRADAEPSTEQKHQLTQTVLAQAAINTIADGTVGTAWLRALLLDPTYQLK